MKKELNFFLIILFLYGSLFGLVDLEASRQEFVLKTQKVAIKGFPDAFNPSIIRWNNQFLMSFRARDPSSGQASLVGLVELNEHFQPVGTAQLLYTCGLNNIQDARLIVVDNKLYMPFSALFPCGRRMCIAELLYDGKQFSIVKCEPLLHFDGDGRKFEKNWTPFEYNEYLLLSYTMFPHKVFLPLFGEGKCLTVDYTQAQESWMWGEVRGGTQAFLVNNQYLAFFHSSIVMASQQSNGKSMPHYFMGAITFENTPPFYIKKISPEPIVGPNFYNGKTYSTWKPLRVVFPCGYVFDDKYIWVAYGRQDHEVWIVQLDKNGLMKSLRSL